MFKVGDRIKRVEEHFIFQGQSPDTIIKITSCEHEFHLCKDNCKHPMEVVLKNSPDKVWCGKYFQKCSNDWSDKI